MEVQAPGEDVSAPADPAREAGAVGAPADPAREAGAVGAPADPAREAGAVGAPADPARGLVWTVCVSAFLVSLDSYIVNVSLPTIQHEFHSSLGTVSWVLLSYLLLLACTSLIFGRLADRHGVRPLFLGGYAVFLASSVLCGLAPGVWWLVAARCLQALGGAMLAVSGFAALPRFVPEAARGRAFGSVATAGALGVIAGAPIGGVINGAMSWPWIFYVNVPICIVGMAVAFRCVPREGLPPPAAPFDMLGALLSLVSLLSLAGVLSKGHEMGWLSVPIVAGAIGGLVMMGVFGWWERTCPSPLVDPRLLAHPRFTLALLALTAGFSFMGGSNFLMPFYLEGPVGMRPEMVGFVLMVYCIVYIIVAPHGGRLADRLDPLHVGTWAMGGAAVAATLFALVLGGGSLVPPVLYLALLGVASGFFIAPLNHAITAAVPPQERGAASGVMNVTVRMGLVLGICLFQATYGGVSSTHPVLAFRAAYVMGGALCLLAALASRLASRRRPC